MAELAPISLPAPPLSAVTQPTAQDGVRVVVDWLGNKLLPALDDEARRQRDPTEAAGVISLAATGGAGRITGDVDFIEGTAIDLTQNSPTAQDITIAANLTTLSSTFLRIDGTNVPTAEMDWNGQTTKDHGGITSSNAALLSFIADPPTGAGIIGMNLTWNGGAAIIADTYVSTFGYNNGSVDEDILRVGFGSTTNTSILWLMDENAPGGMTGITGADIVAGDQSDLSTEGAGTCGLELRPNDFNGQIIFRGATEKMIDMRPSNQQIIFGDGYSFDHTGTGTSGVFNMRVEDAIGNLENGLFQFGKAGNTQLSSGFHTIFTDKIPSASSQPRYRIASVRWDGAVLCGRSGFDSDVPADGIFGAHGWLDSSNGAGNNQAGVDTIIQGGPGTGENDDKGGVLIKTPNTIASGNTEQTTFTTQVQVFRNGRCDFEKSTSHPTETVTAASDTLDETNHTVLCDDSSNNIDINLPASATFDGIIYNVAKITDSVNTVTLNGNGSETIDGGLNAVLTVKDETITVQSLGSGTPNWKII